MRTNPFHFRFASSRLFFVLVIVQAISEIKKAKGKVLDVEMEAEDWKEVKN